MKRMKEYQIKRNDNSPFASRYPVWINVCLFEMCKVKLAGRGLVAVGPGEEHRHLKLREDPKRRGTGMVGGVIQHNDGVLPPPWSLLIQGLGELVEVDLHDLGVGICLH